MTIDKHTSNMTLHSRTLTLLTYDWNGSPTDNCYVSTTFLRIRLLWFLHIPPHTTVMAHPQMTVTVPSPSPDCYSSFTFPHTWLYGSPTFPNTQLSWFIYLPLHMTVMDHRHPYIRLLRFHHKRLLWFPPSPTHDCYGSPTVFRDWTVS